MGHRPQPRPFGAPPPAPDPAPTRTPQPPRPPRSPRPAAAPARPGPRGLRGPGRGRVSYVEAPPEWRGTTVQVCGLFPFSVGGGSPTIGVPLGRNLLTGATVCCDPLAWFQRAKLILNPSTVPARPAGAREEHPGPADGDRPGRHRDRAAGAGRPQARLHRHGPCPGRAGPAAGPRLGIAQRPGPRAPWTRPLTSWPRPVGSPTPLRCVRRPTAGAPRWSRRC